MIYSYFKWNCFTCINLSRTPRDRFTPVSSLYGQSSSPPRSFTSMDFLFSQWSSQMLSSSVESLSLVVSASTIGILRCIRLFRIVSTQSWSSSDATIDRNIIQHEPSRSKVTRLAWRFHPSRTHSSRQNSTHSNRWLSWMRMTRSISPSDTWNCSSRRSEIDASFREGDQSLVSSPCRNQSTQKQHYCFARTRTAMYTLERIARCVQMNEPVLLCGETGNQSSSLSRPLPVL